MPKLLKFEEGFGTISAKEGAAVFRKFEIAY
jgi:hypothetical protein